MIKFDVTNRFSGAVQFTAEIDCDEGASVSIKLGLAVQWAIKARANLAGAYLADAYLAGAKGFHPERTTPLASLKFMTAPLQAFKLVNGKGEGPMNGGVRYVVGETVEELDADCNPANQCSNGLNVADLPWCLREHRDGYRILLVQFDAADIACVPHGTDGKFRVKRLHVVKDVTGEVFAAMPVPEKKAEAA